MLTFREIDKIFVTTDTHIHHKQNFVWGARGFASMEAHDKAVIDSINDTVKYDDILFHLGDLCLNTTLPQFEEILSQLNCQNIYMLWGNHPNPHYKNVYLPIVKKILGNDFTPESEVYPIRYRNVIYIGNYVEVSLGGQYCVLQHYPIMVWNHMKGGAWMLCGHSHGAYEPTTANYPEGKILDCNWDDFKKPLSLSEIRAIMDKKKIVGAGHHTPD